MDDGPDIGQLTKQLTRRQAQVIGLAARGMSDKEIARHLGLSRRTVQDHFGAARDRWGAAIRAELIAMAVATGSTQPARDPRSETGEFANKISFAEPPADVRLASGSNDPGSSGGPGSSGDAGSSGDPGSGSLGSCRSPGSPLDPAHPVGPQGRGHGHSHGRGQSQGHGLGLGLGLNPEPERRRPGRPTVMTPERIAAARELLRDHTVTEVARKLGIGRTTLHQHMAVITAAGAG